MADISQRALGWANPLISGRRSCSTAPSRISTSHFRLSNLLNPCNSKSRERSFGGGADRSNNSEVLIVFDDLRGDGELLVLLVGQPQPSPDLGEDVLHPFPVPQLVEDDDLVFPELIAIVVVCHSVSPFLVDALRVSETKKAQPI